LKAQPKDEGGFHLNDFLQGVVVSSAIAGAIVGAFGSVIFHNLLFNVYSVYVKDVPI